MDLIWFITELALELTNSWLLRNRTKILDYSQQMEIRCEGMGCVKRTCVDSLQGDC